MGQGQAHNKEAHNQKGAEAPLIGMSV